MHEAVAGTIPASRSQAIVRETVSDAHVMQITLRVTPAPTARPAPQPILTPRPVFATTAPAPIGRADRNVAISVHRIRDHRATHGEANARPVWESAAGQATNSAAGTGSQSDGSTAGSAEPPCGFVTFSDPHGSHFDTQTHGFWVDIRMSVHFADGSSQSVILDYPWYYPSEAANPWSAQNVKDLDFPTRFQAPPANKAGNEPPLVQYVAQHSTADGMTLLRDCPAATTPGR